MKPEIKINQDIDGYYIELKLKNGIKLVSKQSYTRFSSAKLGAKRFVSQLFERKLPFIKIYNLYDYYLIAKFKNGSVFETLCDYGSRRTALRGRQRLYKAFDEILNSFDLFDLGCQTDDLRKVDVNQFDDNNLSCCILQLKTENSEIKNKIESGDKIKVEFSKGRYFSNFDGVVTRTSGNELVITQDNGSKQ